MNVLNRKLMRDLTAARGMLLALLSIIVVGVLCFVTMASAWLNLEQSRQRYYAQTRMADFEVHLRKVPLQELQEKLSGLPGVAEFRSRVVFEVTADVPGVERPLTGRVISLPGDPRPVINDIVLRRGVYFTDERQAEVIVHDGFARARNLKPGDRLRLILNQRIHELTIVGTAISSEFVYLLGPGGLIPDNETYGVFYVPERFAREVFDLEGAANNVVGRLVREFRDRPAAVLDRIEQELDDYGVSAVTPLARQQSHWFLMSEIDGLKVTVVIVPTLFLSVAVILLNVLMTRIAEQQRTIAGTLKALGYTNAELFSHYVWFGAAVGVAGGVAGVLLGWLCAGGMMNVYAEYYEFPELANRPQYLVMAGGLLLSVVFSVAGTLHGIRRILQLSPAESMRPKPPVRAKRILLERWPWLWRRLDFRWQLVLRGLVRNRMRTASGVFAAAVGAMLMLLMFHMGDAMNEMISFQFDRLLISDFDLTFRDVEDGGAVLEVARMPGVDVVEPQFSVGCTFLNGHRKKKGSVTGLVRGARLTVPRDTSGNAVRVPTAGLLLTRKLAEELGVGPGDLVGVTPVRGHRQRMEFPVAGIADSYLGMAAYANYEWLNHRMGETDAVTTVQLRVDPRPAVVGQFYRALKQLPAIGAVNAIRENRRKLVEVLVEQMTFSIALCTVFAGALFLGSILNASLISLAERSQEIATLRVLGYTVNEAGQIFLRESLCVNLAGVCLGLPAGYGMCRLINRAYATELFRLPFVIQPGSWIVTVLLGVGFTLLAQWPVWRVIRRQNWQETLNARE